MRDLDAGQEREWQQQASLPGSWVQAPWQKRLLAAAGLTLLDALLTGGGLRGRRRFPAGGCPAGRGVDRGAPRAASAGSSMGDAVLVRSSFSTEADYDAVKQMPYKPGRWL